MRHTNRSKTWWGAGPRLKCLTMAWTTRGWVLGLPCTCDSSSNLQTMFCLRNPRSSISSLVIVRTLAAMFFFQRGKLQGVTWSCDTPMGGGMQAKASKILILCYYVSIFYPIDCYKNIQNIENCSWTPLPPGGGGVVWHTSCEFRTTTHQMAWLEWGQ